MGVFTHVPTRTALNHDTRSKKERSKADEETELWLRRLRDEAFVDILS